MNNRIALVLDGWDISKLNLADAMRRAQVLDVAVQDQVQDTLAKMQPRPSIYDPDFIAANQVRHFLLLFSATSKLNLQRIRVLYFF